MPDTVVTRQLRFFVLLVCSGLLATEAFFHYRDDVFAEYDQTEPTTQLTSELQQLTPPPTPVPTSTPAANYKITSFKEVTILDSSQIAAAQKSFLSREEPTLITRIAIYDLQYQITGKDGSWRPVSAQVYIPVAEDTYPLFVFGSGTTGVADKCAPSLENVAIENMGNYTNHMISQAAAGFVSIFPDYEGFHDATKTQAYFISESEATVLLGAIKSLLELRATTPTLAVADTSTVFLAGYSQGGHAALSTAQRWVELPAEVQLAGVIQYAGAADVQALFNESPWLASYLVASYTEYYDSELQPSAVLKERWLSELQNNNDRLCVNQAYQYYPHIPTEIYAQGFLEALESNTWPDVLRGWKNKIDDNTPLSNLPNVPYLSIQGAIDPIVTAKTQRSNVAKLCADDRKVLYQEYTGINHFQIRKASFSFTNDWIKNVMTDQPISSSCQ